MAVAYIPCDIRATKFWIAAQKYGQGSHEDRPESAVLTRVTTVVAAHGGEHEVRVAGREKQGGPKLHSHCRLHSRHNRFPPGGACIAERWVAGVGVETRVT